MASKNYSQQADLISTLESLIQENCDSSSPLWRNFYCQIQMMMMTMMKRRRSRSTVVMKRRARLGRRIIRRPRNAVERKVRVLRKLIPNCESKGVERLFRETADYIVALQMRVKVMQTVVDLLSAGSDD